MRNTCKGCTWLTKDKGGYWCNDLDCEPDYYDPNCNYNER